MQEAYRILAFWDILKPAIAIMRRDGTEVYLGFEFMASRASSLADGLKPNWRKPKGPGLCGEREAREQLAWGVPKRLRYWPAIFSMHCNETRDS